MTIFHGIREHEADQMVRLGDVLSILRGAAFVADSEASESALDGDGDPFTFVSFVEEDATAALKKLL